MRGRIVRKPVQHLRGSLKVWELRSPGLKHLVITHLHRDYVGLVNYTKSISKAEAYAHEKACGLVEAT
ncbi:MAG: MBL fold metallo-hydrolase [Candidatus Bathyarchaeia archaeon]|nr:MBL fold metallo-hydrolase [Candidatus Bathyarchaeota archaeon]